MKFAIVILLATACSMAPHESSSESYGKKRDAAIDSPSIDAPAPGAAGWVSCYSSGNPTAACDLSVPRFCCFDNFVAPNNGWCTGSPNPPTCGQSELQCDGSEDCSGSQCWVHQFNDPQIYYVATCTSSPLSGDWQLCHPGDGTCPSGKTCVLAEGEQAQLYGFPPTLYVCYPN